VSFVSLWFFIIHKWGLAKMQTWNYSAAERTVEFRQLQQHLRTLWRSINIIDQDDCDILVVPLMLMDITTLTVDIILNYGGVLEQLD